MKTRLNLKYCQGKCYFQHVSKPPGTEEWHDLINNIVTELSCVQIIAICSHATEHWVQETDKMPKLDWHASKQASSASIFQVASNLWNWSLLMIQLQLSWDVFNKGANCVQWSRWRSEAVLIPSHQKRAECSVWC